MPEYTEIVAITPPEGTGELTVEAVGGRYRASYSGALPRELALELLRRAARIHLSMTAPEEQAGT